MVRPGSKYSKNLSQITYQFEATNVAKKSENNTEQFKKTEAELKKLTALIKGAHEQNDYRLSLAVEATCIKYEAANLVNSKEQADSLKAALEQIPAAQKATESITKKRAYQEIANDSYGKKGKKRDGLPNDGMREFLSSEKTRLDNLNKGWGSEAEKEFFKSRRGMLADAEKQYAAEQRQTLGLDKKEAETNIDKPGTEQTPERPKPDKTAETEDPEHSTESLARVKVAASAFAKKGNEPENSVETLDGGHAEKRPAASRHQKKPETDAEPAEKAHPQRSQGPVQTSRNGIPYTDHGDKFVPDKKAPAALSGVSLAEAAAEQGWKSIKLNGDETFRRAAWIEATAQGLEVHGYEPNDKDQAAAEARKKQVVKNPEQMVNEKSKAEEHPTESNNGAPSRSTEAGASRADGATADRSKDISTGRNDAISRAAHEKIFEEAIAGLNPAQQDKAREVFSKRYDEALSAGREPNKPALAETREKEVQEAQDSAARSRAEQDRAEAQTKEKTPSKSQDRDR